MQRWSVRQLFGLMLAVFLAAGMSLSVAPAGGSRATTAMAAMMSMSPEMGASSHGDCDGCPMKGDDGAKAMVCGTMCASPIMAMAPPVAPLKLVEMRGSFAAPESRLCGRTSPPDPYPPRPSDIG